MLEELLVLGKVPGTNVELSITTIVAVSGMIVVGMLVYLLFRTRISRLLRSVKELMTIDFISL